LKSSKLSTLLYLYILFVCVWFFLWLTIGDGTWLLTLLNRVVPYLFLPVPLFLAWLMRTREYKLAALLILPLSIFGNLYHPYMFPQFAKPDGIKSDLTVLTYNVLFSNFDYDAAANVVLTYHPDLVALQEVEPQMMSALKERLGSEYPYSILGTHNYHATTAVFSRHPFAEAYVLDLEADRRAVIVKLEVNHQSITFAAVHLRAYGLQWVRPLINIPQAVVERTNAQNRQVEILLDELQSESGSVIIGCDCNSKETSSSYRMLNRWFDTTAYRVGWRFPGIELAGARQDTNMQHIDFIWYRGTLEPLAAYEIKDRGGSDHHPVLAVFDLR
jgi:endonuclease/exonuclease/phosphatase (EEP) superfamily protein YafD